MWVQGTSGITSTGDKRSRAALKKYMEKELQERKKESNYFGVWVRGVGMVSALVSL
jgi:hypothetical protein